MSNANYNTEQLNSIKKMRRRGFINNDELQELKEFNEQRKNGALSNDDFLDIKGLYNFKYRSIISVEKFREVIELYKQKINGVLTDESAPKYCFTKFCKLKLLGHITDDEFKDLQGILRGYDGKEEELQELMDFYFLGKKGMLNEDDFSCLKMLFGMRRHYYIKDDEFPAIIELYKQKIKGILSAEIIEPGEEIPEYNITRLFKLKLLGRISLEKFETMKELLRQYMGYKSLLNSIFSNTPENELKKEEKALLLFLMENGPEE